MPMRIVTSRGTNVMSKLNPQNERIKRDYLRYLKNARGKSEATLDAVRKALSRFEDYTGARDLKTFRREQAIGFKERLAETNRQGTGETLSLATQSVTVAALKEFFTWLAWQPGFKSRIHVPDIDYFSLSMKDRATAKAKKLRDFPSLRNGPFGRDVVQAPGGASGLSHDETRCAAFAGAGASSASATCRFRESIPHPVQPLSTLRTPRRRDARKTRSRPACSALNGPDFHWQAHSSFPLAPRIRLSDKTSRGLSRATPSAASEHHVELIGCPISMSFATFCVCLELRSLPSAGVTRFPRCRVGGGALSDLGADLRPPLKLDVQFSRIQLSWIGLRSLKRRYQRD